MLTATPKRRNAYLHAQRKTALFFLAPNLIGFLAFVIYPLFKSLYISFFNWDGLTPATFVGFANYQKLFTDQTFRISFQNNIHYTLVTVLFSIVFGIMMALLMNVKLRGIGFFRTIYFLPQVTSLVAIGIVWSTILANYGPVNQLLMGLGIEAPPKWISSTKYALISVEIVSIWRSMGYNAIILLAGLQGISPDLYEAAKIDGANSRQRFQHVTLPMLSPTIFFCTVMAIIGSFQVFDTIMAMTQGGPGRATNVLTYYIYQLGFVQFKFGYASAIAYVLFIIILVLTLIQFIGQRKWVTYS